jgi:two-component system, LytTR family, sensor histidine kinase AlgZ
MASPDVFATTLRALAAPRRAVPIAAVSLALVAVQLYYHGTWRAALVPAALVGSFVLLAPWGWRRLLAEGTSLSGGISYGLFAVVVVAACGVALPHALGLGQTYFTDVGSLGISVVLFVVGGWGLGRDIELERGLEHARLLALHTHLDPHFLYNTLNAIAEWCAEDAAVAEEAITRLAGMMREMLAGLELSRWPLARELALATDLLELHRLRDPGALEISVALPEALAALEVPPLVVLALVENAVKHGPRAGHHGRIEVTVTRDAAASPARVRCVVENPGPFAPAPPSGGSGHGLRTLRRRLAHAYRGAAALQIGPAGDAAGPRTRATLALPEGAP